MKKEKRTSLKVFRVQNKLSQEQIATKLGFSRGHYAKFENGEQDITLRFLEALTKVFGITFDEAKNISKRDDE